MDREARRATVHGVAKSRTQLSDCTELNSKILEWVPTLASNSHLWRSKYKSKDYNKVYRIDLFPPQ